MFSAIRHDPEPPERVTVGQKRAAEKIGYFQDFLTDLYELWRAAKNTDSNPYFFFKVIRKDYSNGQGIALQGIGIYNQHRRKIIPCCHEPDKLLSSFILTWPFKAHPSISDSDALSSANTGHDNHFIPVVVHKIFTITCLV